MSIKLDKKAFEKLIEEDIYAVRLHFPSHSIIRDHIIAILSESIKFHYPEQSRQAAVSGSVCEHDFEYQKLGTIGSKVLKCTKCGKIAN